MYARDHAARQLGIEVDEVRAGYARTRMVLGSWTRNGHGVAHGGVLFALADTAFAYACNTAEQNAVARQCEITFLRPAHVGDEVVACAELRASAGRSGIYDVRVTGAGRDGAEIVVAEMRGHSATIDRREA